MSLETDGRDKESVSILEPQSGGGSFNITNQSGSPVYQNVEFMDQNDPYVLDVDSSMDPTRTLQDTTDTSLENFFSRPVKISEENWQVGTALNYDLDPWSLYFDNPRVANRTNNYSLLRAKLHVKAVINGNGFHYGRMIAGYNPLNLYDSLSTFVAGTADNMQVSQLPHFFLDPTTSAGGEMVLPFFYFRNYLQITTSDWSRMGRLYLRTLNPLAHANGATDNATVTIFAWAEDVELSVLTSVDQDTLVPQSGEVDEANREGIVSGPATKVAKWAAYFKGIPYIQPFALATEIGASAVASMAKIFGYSRPPVTRAPEPYRPQPISSLAVTNVPDVCQKLTVDDKQELTIDPRITGIGGADAMSIRSLASRESYLTTFSWNVSSGPDQLLWNARIDPVTWAITAGTPDAYHFPACAVAALPFKYWKGTMKFRFQFVASSFHKGRVRIVYDPNFLSDSTYLTYQEYNVNYLKVVDLAEEQDFTIEVGMAQDTSYVEHHSPGTDSVTQMYSTTRYSSKEEGNGVIGVYVVNELTTPNSTVANNIQVNVFVSMGDDFEVAVPSGEFANFVVKPYEPLAPQSGEVVPESQNTSEPSAPEHKQTTILGLPPADSSQLNHVFFGESIASFRTILKRYALWNTIPKRFGAPRMASGRFPIMPYWRGSVSGAVDRTTSNEPYNYCNTLLLHWLAACHAGYRGSIRYKLVPVNTSDNGYYAEVQRVANKASEEVYVYNNAVLTDPGTISGHRSNLVVGPYNAPPDPNKYLLGTEGKTLAINSVNGILEFEMPYYTEERFTSSRIANLTTNMNDSTTAWDYRCSYSESGANTVYSTTHVYAAAGEDFQFYFFTGMPRMYYESTAPDPS